MGGTNAAQRNAEEETGRPGSCETAENGQEEAGDPASADGPTGAPQGNRNPQAPTCLKAQGQDRGQALQAACSRVEANSGAPRKSSAAAAARAQAAEAAAS